MADEFRPDQAPIPAVLLAPDICCAVYSEKAGTWRRARILRVERDLTVGPPQTMADVHLVDTGFERRFPAGALKPIDEHFMTYLPYVFLVKLAHPYFESIRWRPEDTEEFCRMVETPKGEKRMLIMKFMTNTLPVFEVSCNFNAFFIWGI